MADKKTKKTKKNKFSGMGYKNLTKQLASSDAWAKREYRTPEQGGTALYFRHQSDPDRGGLIREYEKRLGENPHSDVFRLEYWKNRNKIRKKEGLKPLSLPRELQKKKGGAVKGKQKGMGVALRGGGAETRG